MSFKGRKHSAHDSGMRGREPRPQDPTEAAAEAKASRPAYDSGMRGNEADAAVAEQAAVKSAAMETAPQTSQEAAALALAPGAISGAIGQPGAPAAQIEDAGDHYRIPKAGLVDHGDHYKLAKKSAPPVHHG